MAKRKANGEGSLTKLGSGNYRLRVVVEVDGVRQRKSFTASSPTACRRDYQAWMLSDRKVAVERVRTVAQWAAHWLETYKKPSVSWQVGRDYEMYVNKHILPAALEGGRAFGSLRLDDVRPAHVRRLMAGLRNARGGPLGQSGANYCKIALQGIFGTAVENRLCAADPTVGIRLERRQQQEVPIFTRTQMARILEHLDRHEHGPAIALLLMTGLRPGELLALMWSEVDTQEQVLKICRRLVRCEGGEQVLPGTKGKRIRYAAYGDALGHYLAKLPRRGLYVIAREVGTPDGGAVSTHHTHDSFAGLYYSFFDDLNETIRREHRLSGAAGEPELIPRLTPHKCRHTFATYAVRSGMGQGLLQKQLGHASSATTEGYTHVNVDDLKNGVARIRFG